ncbi:ribonuclease P [Candidatus Woesearchaeota archaeon]|nr:MAG: ribonuclease P [Candidatus Woesearchaeota archaeon]
MSRRNSTRRKRRSNWKKPSKQKSLAKERVASLFSLAEQCAASHPTRAIRYVQLARRIGMRNKVSLAPFKKRFCKHCNTYFLNGVNARVRIHRGRLIITCLSCKHIRRFLFVKKRAGEQKKK